MAKTLKSGDKVSWDSSGGHSTGHVVKKDAAKGKGLQDDPKYVVESDKSGKRASHKASALKKG
ncbi:DUF2945 domain-containing protein [Aureimonas leprariae]|uniref:DUF2945 domain-containing protein n=1 Tax=Plantimonas leprariae TaxID=2615207 RepID=A0A7V7PKB0_9HYPH|nr:DUF2945 domain-containing protein [Aureimonas leprariae]KAB0676187.1 DUF2945 domain-containing protein [Aureimonas leprariae]